MKYAELCGGMAHTAALWEVHAAPKPGLVDRLNSGAHKDMNYTTFVRSALALAPFWKEQYRQGILEPSPRKAFPSLRSRGCAMEKAMFRATEDINTHKGLIFVLSLLLYGAGNTRNSSVKALAETICARGAEAVQGMICRELAPLKKASPHRELTHGERLYLEHGVTGIRGEAEKGFPSLLQGGLPALRHALGEGCTFHDANLYALLHIMLHAEDSTVIHRGGYGFWKGAYREEIRRVLSLGAPFTGKGKKALEELDRSFSRHRISPGGAADLLSAATFLFLWETVQSSLKKGLPCSPEKEAVR